MRVLVTGASGVLGRNLLPMLADHEVVALSRAVRKDEGHVRWVRADLATGNGVEAAMDGVECIVHCATHPLRTAATDLHGLQRLVHEAPQARVVYPSIVGVDAVAFPYYQQKLATERWIEEEAEDHAIVRLTQFHEFPHQLADLPVPIVPMHFRTQPIAAREAAALLADAIEGPRGRLPDAGGPEVHDLKALVQRVLAARGSRKPVLSIPMPGSTGFRKGLNLAPHAKVGKQTWEQHFASCSKEGDAAPAPKVRDVPRSGTSRPRPRIRR